MTSADFDFDPQTCRPLPGRIVLTLDEPPERIGAILIPDVARHHRADSDELLCARVVNVGYGEFWIRDGDDKWARWYPGLREDQIKPGDKVLFAALMKDLDKKYIVTDVRRVRALVE